MPVSPGSSTNGGKTPLAVVCCARADSDELRKPLDALRSEGIVVELVDGIDEDPKSLTGTIDGLDGEGLYVLCRSRKLGREAIEELREILLARHIPFGRTLTVSLGGRASVADRIRTGLRRMGANVAEPSRGASRGPSRTIARENTAVTRREPAPTDPAAGLGPVPPLTGFEEDEPTLVGRREQAAAMAATVDEEGPTATRPRLATPPPLPGGAPPSAARRKKASPAVPPAPPRPPGARPRVPTPMPPIPTAKAEPPPAKAAPAPKPAAASEPAPSPPRPEPPREKTDTTAKAQTSIVEEIDPSLIDDPSSLSNPAISLSDLDFSDLDDSRVDMRPPGPGDSTSVGSRPVQATGNTVIGPAPAMITGDTLTGEKLPGSLKAAAEAAHAARKQASAPSQTSAIITGETITGETLPSSLKEAAEAAFAEMKANEPAQATEPGQPVAAMPPAPPPTNTPPPPTSTPPASTTTVPSTPVPPPPSASPYPQEATAGSSLPTTPITQQPWFPWAAGAAAAVLLGVLTVVAWPDGDDDDGDDTVASNESADEPDKRDEAKDEPDPSTPPPDDNAPKAEADRADNPPPRPPDSPLMVALRSRQVRALDVLLMASELAAPGDHDNARKHCDRLAVEGLGQWRLPQVGELSSLARANMIGRGYYWSSTAADTFGDTFMVWNQRRGQAQRPRNSAIAVCVRGGATGT